MGGQVFRMLSPICRVRVGDWEWESWDNKPNIKYASVELGEDDRASSCRSEIFDPDFEVAEELLKISFEKGGIEVPFDLLTFQQPLNVTQGTGLAGVSGTPNVNIGAGFQEQNFGYEFGKEPLELMEKLIVQYCLANGVTDVGQIAYILATAGHEACADMSCRLEFASGEDYNNRLGNGPTEGPTYKGRGLVHITGKNHYRTFSKIVNHDLVSDPKYAERTDVAIYIMVVGMRDGLFTGVKLSEYINGGQKDYYGARAIVNGTDMASKIAGEAEAYEKKVPGIIAGLGSTPVTPPPTTPATKPETKPATPDKATITPLPANPKPVSDETKVKPDVTPTTTTPTVEVSKRGTEIIIELGYHPNQMVAYHFIHTGTKLQGRQLDATTIEGKCIRWLMTRRTKNSTYQGINLRQLAETVCKGYGLDLKMEGDGPTYKHLDQSGISDYDLLLREARAVGFRVSDDGGKSLIIEPYRAHFTGFCITKDILNEFSLKDEANKDRPVGLIKPVSATGNLSSEFKTDLDRVTGGLISAWDDKTGKGTTDVASVTGAATPPLHGTMGVGLDKVEPGKVPVDAKSEIKAETKPEGTSLINTVKTEIFNNKEADKTPKDNPALRTIESYLKEKKVPDKILTGLTNQPIALDSGKLEAESLKQEANRIKGYQGTATFKTVPEALMLAPGSIIAIADECFPRCPSLCREWRIEKVKHSFQNGKLETTIDFYTPMGFKVPLNLPTPGTGLTQISEQKPSTGTITQTAVGTSGWMWPIKRGEKGLGNPPNYVSSGWLRSSGEFHGAIDIGGADDDDKTESPVLASKAGVVFNILEMDPGAGNMVHLKHPDGSESVYMHLEKFSCKKNDQVAQGQELGIRGNTGKSTAPHLHFEIWINDQRVDPLTLLPTGYMPLAAYLGGTGP